mmetsp:Transcript_18587/g.40430  ORF Transcript_18587/g.40430 Transcript_18587/m.40430 type:complete len:231 (-) Transcript_18587:263-955(-)
MGHLSTSIAFSRYARLAISTHITMIDQPSLMEAHGAKQLLNNPISVNPRSFCNPSSSSSPSPCSFSLEELVSLSSLCCCCPSSDEPLLLLKVLADLSTYLRRTTPFSSMTTSFVPSGLKCAVLRTILFCPLAILMVVLTTFFSFKLLLPPTPPPPPPFPPPLVMPVHDPNVASTIPPPPHDVANRSSLLNPSVCCWLIVTRVPKRWAPRGISPRATLVMISLRDGTWTER